MYYTSTTKELGEVHLVYSARTAKQPQIQNSQRRRTKLSDTTALFAYGSDTISVADALNLVKDSFNDVLPLDVLNKLGSQRKITKDTPFLRYSLSDEDYMDAVERGDMETAARMVEEAAKNAGYTIRAWHGSNAERFTTFKPGARGEMWFASTEGTAYKRKNMYVNHFVNDTVHFRAGSWYIMSKQKPRKPL